MRFVITLALCALTLPCPSAQAWGFWAHRKINNLAVFTLPAPMLRFYKYHHAYLTEAAPNPDKRRSTDPKEAPRHFIDTDVRLYGDSGVAGIPRYYDQAVARYSQDSIEKYGTVPWHIRLTCVRLTEAFKRQDVVAILELSADLGHYAGDANVPLHTTVNYDGQRTDQRGIHALWESRLPELYASGYNYFTGPAHYEPQIQLRAWAAVTAAHIGLDSVLRFERQAEAALPAAEALGYEQRGKRQVKVYKPALCQIYHQALGGQVERRLRASIALTGDLWLSCWMDAGQPDMDALIGPGPDPATYTVLDPGVKLPGVREEE